MDLADDSNGSHVSRATPGHVEAAVCVAGILLLAGMVVSGRPDLTYDEPDYLATVGLLESEGLSVKFLREYPVGAGPLFAVVHWLASPATHLEAPGVRLLQVSLLLASIACLAGAASALRYQRPWHGAALILAVPMTFTVSGMALTEIPAVMFSSLGVWQLALADRTELPRKRLLATATAGLALGIAATGRQPLISVLALVPLLGLTGRWQWSQILLLMLAGSLLPLLLFGIWGGFVSPKLAWVDGLSLRNGTWALAYAGVALLFIKPSALRFGGRSLLAMLLASFAWNSIMGYQEYVPLRPTLVRLAPAYLPLIGKIVGSGMVFAGAMFVAALGREIVSRRLEGVPLFLATAALAVAAANVKVEHFSTRYLVPVLPFLVFVGGEEHPSWWRAGRLAIGLAIGAISLSNYILP